ncbi:DUF6541 family protein [Demequina sp. NBRC 110052]|uniref:DUF6541 family protein n=1 Tax=Demequina sp. NBRC 110052 TaxID=1570341 RepID=UPI000A04BF11|nr:DUF6541 family protein [Demequina sp. NBRC 110052]
MAEWWSLVPAMAIGVVLVVVPGLAVMLASFRVAPLHLLAAPALSVAILAISAVIAGAVGVPWSVLPVLAVTVALAIIGLILRRFVPQVADGPAFSQATGWAPLAAVGVAGIILAWRLMDAFVSPESISQTFDAVVHLNAIEGIRETGNASAFAINTRAGAPFYPNGWHAFTSLVAQLSGLGVPQAINASNVVIGALIWPASALAMAVAFFPRSLGAAIAAGVGSVTMGIFPYIPLFFGVLYPNLIGYSMLGGTAALLFVALRPGGRLWSRETLLLAFMLGGQGVAHPNSLLAAVVLAAPVLFWELGRRIAADRSRRTIIAAAATASGVILASMVVWLLARTSRESSGWPPWASLPRVLGEALTIAPSDLPLLSLGSLALASSIVLAIRRPARFEYLAPFAGATVLFLLAAGVDTSSIVRNVLTNPWYSDPFRLAMLLGPAAIPAIAMVGSEIEAWLARLHAQGSRITARPVLAGVVAAVLMLAAIAADRSVDDAVARTQQTYTTSDDSALLSTDERALLERADPLIDDGALVAGSPRTGANLIDLWADVVVVDYHIYPHHTEDEDYVNHHLADIDSDPEVCAAVERSGIRYVIDFGERDVHNARTSYWDGIVDLEPGDHLVLLDSEGEDARLFAIVGCGD